MVGITSAVAVAVLSYTCPDGWRRCCANATVLLSRPVCAKSLGASASKTAGCDHCVAWLGVSAISLGLISSVGLDVNDVAALAVDTGVLGMSGEDVSV